MGQEEKIGKNLLVLLGYLFVVWGFYRLLFQLPEPFEDLLAKPFIFLTALLLFLRSEGKALASVGFHKKNLFRDISISIFLAVPALVLGLIVVILKYRGVVPATYYSNASMLFVLTLSIISAFSEELVLRGYMLNRVIYLGTSKVKAVAAVSLFGLALFVPMVMLDWRAKFEAGLIILLLVLLFNFVSSLLALKTRSVVASIITHIFFILPILLFR